MPKFDFGKFKKKEDPVKVIPEKTKLQKVIPEKPAPQDSKVPRKSRSKTLKPEDKKFLIELLRYFMRKRSTKHELISKALDIVLEL